MGNIKQYVLVVPFKTLLVFLFSVLFFFGGMYFEAVSHSLKLRQWTYVTRCNAPLELGLLFVPLTGIRGQREERSQSEVSEHGIS